MNLVLCAVYAPYILCINKQQVEILEVIEKKVFFAMSKYHKPIVYNICLTIFKKSRSSCLFASF